MKRLAFLLILALAACESPLAPDACGPIPQVTVNAGETATVTACFNDPNGDMLVYSATSSNPGVAIVSNSGANVTVSAVSPGSASVTVTASDPGGLQGEQRFQVVVPNRPPVAWETIPDIEMFVGDTVEGDAAELFTDPDGDTLSYTASTSDAGVVSVSVSGSTVTVAAVAAGSATLTVTATDPGGLSAQTAASLTVLGGVEGVELVMNGQVIASYDSVTKSWTGELEVHEGEETSHIVVRFVDGSGNPIPIDDDLYLEVEFADTSIAEWEQDVPGEFGGHLRGLKAGETDVTFKLMRGAVGSGHPDFVTGPVRVSVIGWGNLTNHLDDDWNPARSPDTTKIASPTNGRRE